MGSGTGHSSQAPGLSRPKSSRFRTEKKGGLKGHRAPRERSANMAACVAKKLKVFGVDFFRMIVTVERRGRLFSSLRESGTA